MVVVVVVVSGSGVTALVVSIWSLVLSSFSPLVGGHVRFEQKKRPSIQMQVLQSCLRRSPSLHSGTGFTVVVVVVVVVVVTISGLRSVVLSGVLNSTTGTEIIIVR